MMRDLEDLLPEVLPYAPNASEIAVLKHLRDACREFCANSKAWRDNDSIEIAAPDFEGLCSGSEADIVEIEDAQLEGLPLTPIKVVDLDKKRRGWRTDTDVSTARYVTQLQPNSVTVYPRQTGTLDIGLILKPSKTALTVPDWLISGFGTEIGKGAAANLLTIPNTDYQNLQLAGPMLSDWRGFLARASRQSRRGQQGAPQRTKGVFF